MPKSIFLIYCLVILDICTCVVPNGVNQPAAETHCPKDDKTCQSDKIGFEAIAQLHFQIDDDKDGSLDRDESSEFIRDDLQHRDSQSRQSNLHGVDDHITVHDLWKHWVTSEVYNWTVDDVVDWLTVNVELPQYAETFRDKSVNGQLLPRLSSMSQSFGSYLGIKNSVHRRKLTVKATDLVLFGPPKLAHNYKKDLALVLSVLVALIGCYFAYSQHRTVQSHVQKVMKDMNALNSAETALSQLQQQLEESQKEQQSISDDKKLLERKLQEEISAARADAERLRKQKLLEGNPEQREIDEEELNAVRTALWEAERRLQESHAVCLPDLQLWLQRTYDVESRYFDEKRFAAEKQLRSAKEMCDKIGKQKGKFLGAFRVAHTTSLNQTDDRITSVRHALEDVKTELKERMMRWKKLEQICGFSIINDVPTTGDMFASDERRPTALGGSLRKECGMVGAGGRLATESRDDVSSLSDRTNVIFDLGRRDGGGGMSMRGSRSKDALNDDRAGMVRNSSGARSLDELDRSAGNNGSDDHGSNSNLSGGVEKKHSSFSKSSVKSKAS